MRWRLCPHGSVLWNTAPFHLGTPSGGTFGCFAVQCVLGSPVFHNKDETQRTWHFIKQSYVFKYAKVNTRRVLGGIESLRELAEVLNLLRKTVRRNSHCLGDGGVRFSRMGIFDIKLQVVFLWNKSLPIVTKPSVNSSRHMAWGVCVCVCNQNKCLLNEWVNKWNGGKWITYSNSTFL